MKTIIYILSVILIATSCSQGKIAKSERGIKRENMRVAEQAAIMKAVESGEFVISLDRIYFRNGGFTELVPSRNFIALDNESIVMRAAYMGRQYDFRPIQGIKIAAKKSTYILKSDPEGKGYEIKTNVEKNGNQFDIYISISKNGYCDVSVNNIKLDNVRYTGRIETEFIDAPSVARNADGEPK
jgi:hypothetical protein